MRLLIALCAALCLASCHVATDGDGPRTASRDTTGHLVAISPANGPTPSVPAVSTSKGILAYDRDLRSCQRASAVVLGSNGSDDDAEALTHSTGSRRLDGVVEIDHGFDDMATKRGRVIKSCLSKRGYVLKG